MKLLKPDARFHLEHRAYFLRGWPGTLMLTAASKEGHVSLVDFTSRTVRLQRPTTKLGAIGPHPTGPFVAYVDGKSGSVVVQSVDGMTIAEFQPPPVAASRSSAANRCFEDCCFDEGGSVLWQLANCTPPVFSRDGSEFLVLTADNTIRRYDFQETKQLGSPLDSGDEGNPFTASMCYLDERHALAGTGEGRVFLVDIERMAIEDEIAIEGHEPRPIGEYYPMLANERGLATDISWFERLGKVVVFIYRRDRQIGLDGWKDSLLCCSLPT